MHFSQLVVILIYLIALIEVTHTLLMCEATHTLCDAAYSANGKGCCVFENAVCCPNRQTCCPQGTVCQGSGKYLTTCVSSSKNVAGKSVCKFGPPEVFDKSRKNVLVIGDSVSIGYTPPLAKYLSDVAKVHHAPYDVMDGGAEETNYGLQCLDYFLRSPYSLEKLLPDVLMFNFGLHDGPLGNDTIPGQQGNSTVYPGELEQIAKKLADFASASTGKVKLLYALTSPMLCNITADGNVQSLNKVAISIMQKYKIPVLDVHKSIINKCGVPPQSSCFNHAKCYCPHCSGKGNVWLAQSTIAPAIRAML